MGEVADMDRVLVLGGGGREHALVRALRRASPGLDLLAAPGNPGIARDGVPCVPLDPGDLSAVVVAAVERHRNLVVVGPEVPLVAGVVDALGAVGIAAVGPSAAAARIEGSKVYAKELMRDAGVPTAPHQVFRSREDAEAHLVSAAYPAVVKADGLAAGKGVVICADEGEARAALDVLLVEKRFGHTAVLLEPFLEGEEVSLLALCDGHRALALAPARDFKRLEDGDRGPNTGGMGAYSPVPALAGDQAADLVRVVHQPVLDEMRRRGTPFHGILYAGLMFTSAGPRVLEFNCRFGDPEAQAVLPRLRGSLLELLECSTRFGGLEGVELGWAPEWAVTVVLAAAGYPGSPSRGDVITGADAEPPPGIEILHAGTAERDGELVTDGGRVLNVTALGASPEEARARAYGAAARIEFPGRRLRGDVGAGVRAQAVA